MGPLRYLFIGILLIVSTSALFCRSTAGGGEFPLKHPVLQGEDLRTCTICHDSDKTFPFYRYNHGMLFIEKHGAAARGRAGVCRMCHNDRQCSVCHSANGGLAPDLRMHGHPKARSPHRGDYLARHRIDGRLKPAGCFKCHGRPKTAKNCRPCHG